GTHVPLRGEPPDPRAQTILADHGYKVARLRSRRISMQDFQKFDLILAMDSSNLTELRRRCPPEHAHKLRLFLSFAEGLTETEVPDPYYGNADGFERVLNLCEAGATGLLKHVYRNYLRQRQ
ncbi:MAG: low molecular weight protein-tyrosine-phosphatase, partial [Pseudomonadota bacterium]